MRLIQIKVLNPLLWPLKLILLTLAGWIFYELALDIESGQLIRRGITYTLENEPRSFYINILKRFVIFSVLVWFGTSGLIGKGRNGNCN